MKVIDLLNKIANEEDIPSPIYYNNLYYDFEDGDYFNKETKNWLFNDSDINTILNDEVKEEKEDKKIEKIWFSLYEMERVNEEVLSKIENKINEIIDYLEENKKC